MANEIIVGPTGMFSTINAGVAAANTYDTVRVQPGTYNEVVVINKTIQLLGAQAGVDARNRSGPESIVTGSDISGIIQVNADNVVVDGFTVIGNTLGPGIHSAASSSGYWIFNNIVHDNSYGIFVDSSGQTETQVRHNLLFNNNIFGNGVYSQSGSNFFIDGNKFNGQHNSASINFTGPAGQANIIISNNQMVNDNSIALSSTTNVKVVNNMMFNTQGSSIFFGGGTNRTDIEGNILQNSISSGIRVTNDFVATPNTNIRAKDNNIQGNAVAGLNIDAGAYAIAPMRLDATNNWWGSPSGPAPIGTGDAVIDPDNVAEITPFLTSPPPISGGGGRTGPFTTGPIKNKDGITLDVLISNDNPSSAVTVELELFMLLISSSGTSKIPTAHQLFLVPANQVITKTLSIAGFEAYEVQFNVTGLVPGDAPVSVFAVDSSGHLIAAQRVLNTESSTISGLTAVP